MAGTKPYPQELRERAVRMVAEVRPNYESDWAAITAVPARLGIGTAEALRKCVRQAQVEGGQRPGVTSEESAELKRLRRENAELRRANEILKAPLRLLRGRARPAYDTLVRFVDEHRDRFGESSRFAVCCASTGSRSPRVATGRPRSVRRRGGRCAIPS